MLSNDLIMPMTVPNSPMKRRAAGDRAEDPQMFPEFLRLLEHRLNGNRIRCFWPFGAVSLQNVQENPASGTMGVLFTNGNRQIALAFLNGLE